MTSLTLLAACNIQGLEAYNHVTSVQTLRDLNLTWESCDIYFPFSSGVQSRSSTLQALHALTRLQYCNHPHLRALDLRDSQQLECVELAGMSKLRQITLNLECVTGLTLRNTWPNLGVDLLQGMLSDAQPAMQFLELHSMPEGHAACIGRLANLSILILHDCQLHHTPPEWASLSNLTRLSIVDNGTDMVVSFNILKQMRMLAHLRMSGAVQRSRFLIQGVSYSLRTSQLELSDKCLQDFCSWQCMQ